MRDVAWAPHTGLVAPILASAGEDGKVRRVEGREGGWEGGKEGSCGLGASHGPGGSYPCFGRRGREGKEGGRK